MGINVFKIDREVFVSTEILVGFFKKAIQLEVMVVYFNNYRDRTRTSGGLRSINMELGNECNMVGPC